MCVNWNENYRKLTTSDQYGLIIVWMLHKVSGFVFLSDRKRRMLTYARHQLPPDFPRACGSKR